MRDSSIDTGRGLLVLLMIYGHTLQFFGYPDVFPAIDGWINAINLLVFPTFVFYFGATTSMAYLDKPYRKALPRMLRTLLRSLCAFWLSGIGYRVLRENKAFAVGTVRRVLMLTDIPCWSEFLIAFALYTLLAMVAFAGFRQIRKRPWLALPVGALCLAATFLPYERLSPTWLCLWIGGTDYSYFPVVQYLPYFLAGVLYAGNEGRIRRWLLGAAALCSLAGGVQVALRGGALPGRFPPEWAWIVLPAAGAALLVTLCRLLSLAPGRAGSWVARPLERALGGIGTRSLYYLLGSNLVLFTLAGKNAAPALSAKGALPWSLPIQSPEGALCWAAVLILSLAFVAALAGRGKPTLAKSPQACYNTSRVVPK